MATVSAVLGQPDPGGSDYDRYRSANPLLQLSATDLLWVLFLIGTTSAVNSIGPSNSERYFWLAADLAVAALLITCYRRFLRTALHNKLLLSWPVLACVSTLWSLAPAISIYHGLQLLMTTLAAFTLMMFESRRKVMQLIFFALLITAAGSLLVIVLKPSMGVGIYGEWQGLFHHKNQLGVYAALLAITGTCLFLQRWHPLISAAGTGLGLAMLMGSRSGTALICLLVAVAPLPLAMCLRRGRRTLSVGLSLLFAVAGIALVLIFATETNLIDAVLGGLGKDRTLTGRLALWDFGSKIFLDHPLLGLGYKGFWEGDPSSVAYLRFLIGQDLWFFHNNVLEVAVAFGIIGPVLLIAGIIQALYRTVRSFIRDAQYTSLWRLQIILYLTVYMNAENPLFQNHSFHQFLFVVAAAACLAPRSSARRNALDATELAIDQDPRRQP